MHWSLALDVWWHVLNVCYLGGAKLKGMWWTMLQPYNSEPVPTAYICSFPVPKVCATWLGRSLTKNGNRNRSCEAKAEPRHNPLLLAPPHVLYTSGQSMTIALRFLYHALVHGRAPCLGAAVGRQSSSGQNRRALLVTQGLGQGGSATHTRARGARLGGRWRLS